MADTSMYSMQPAVKLDPAGAINNANGMLNNQLLQGQVHLQQAQMPLVIDNAQMTNAANRLQFVSNQIAPLIALGDKVTDADVRRAAVNAVSNSRGAISSNDAAGFLMQITQHPQGIPAALREVHMRTLQGLEQAQAMRGMQSTVDTGPAQQHLQTDTYSGAVRNAPGPASAVQTYPSRERMAQSATVGFNPITGAPISGTEQQRVNARGGGDLLAPAFRSTNAPPPLRAGAPGAPGTSARPGAPGGVAPAQGGAPAASPAPAPVASPVAAPGPVEAPMESTAKALQDDFANSSMKMAGTQALLQALPLIESLGPRGAGPSSDVEQRLKSFLVTRGVINADATNVDVRSEAQKYLKKYSLASGGATAGGSDYRTAFASDSNPNLDTDQKATMALARAAVAFDRMDAARPLAFTNDPNAKVNDYSRHKAAWSQSQDARAYGLDLMEPTKRAALVKEMQQGLASRDRSKAEASAKFFRSLKTAHDHQMLTGTTNAGQ